VSDEQLRRLLLTAHELMRGSVEGVRRGKRVHYRAGRACARCGTPILSRPLGEAARTAYWCPTCQKGEEPAAP
jgi:endonuclease-8